MLFLLSFSFYYYFLISIQHLFQNWLDGPSISLNVQFSKLCCVFKGCNPFPWQLCNLPLHCKLAITYAWEASLQLPLSYKCLFPENYLYHPHRRAGKKSAKISPQNLTPPPPNFQNFHTNFRCTINVGGPASVVHKLMWWRQKNYISG